MLAQFLNNQDKQEDTTETKHEKENTDPPDRTAHRRDGTGAGTEQRRLRNRVHRRPGQTGIHRAARGHDARGGQPAGPLPLAHLPGDGHPVHQQRHQPRIQRRGVHRPAAAHAHRDGDALQQDSEAVHRPLLLKTAPHRERDAGKVELLHAHLRTGARVVQPAPGAEVPARD